MKQHLQAACLAGLLMASPVFATQAKRLHSTAQQAVDLNHADASALQELHGIGIAKAKAIIAYRQAHGSFKKIEDLDHVHGISDALIKRIQINNPGRIKLSS